MRIVFNYDVLCKSDLCGKILYIFMDRPNSVNVNFFIDQIEDYILGLDIALAFVKKDKMFIYILFPLIMLEMVFRI